MTEFKTIPNAPDYEVNSEKEIRRVENKKPVFVLNGGKVLLKTADGGMDHFIVEELVAQLFHNQAIEEKCTTIISNNEPNDIPVVLCGNCDTIVGTPNCEDLPKGYYDSSPKRGRGRPKKPVDPNAPVKVKGTGKRGRPAGSKNKPK